MKCVLFILVVLAILNTINSEGVNENNEKPFPVAIVSSEEHQTEAHEENSESELSSVQLADIHDLAKNISHAKGIWREEVDGREKKEVRRSIVKKATIASESDIMKELLLMFESTEDNSVLLDILQKMEDLVHQYDVAVSFANMGGLKIISPLLFSNDDKIVSSVALVLGSAMQSNPTVQKLAMGQNIGRKLLHLLSHKSSQVVPRIVYAISSFLRNSPDAQEEFLSQDGVSRLSDILKSSSVITTTKLKIISLLNDLAVEQKTAKHDWKSRSHEQTHAFRRSFAEEILKHHICMHIAGFLELEDYDSHQKIIDAMLSLNGICHKYFKIDGVKDRLKKLLKIYYPEKHGDHPWIADIDEELRSDLYSGLIVLYEKVNDGQINLPLDKYFTKHVEHSEL